MPSKSDARMEGNTRKKRKQKNEKLKKCPKMKKTINKL